MAKKAIILILLMATTFVLADVNVTFYANSSTVQGVTDSTGGVDLRGAMQGWTAEADPFTSDGGDYWSIVWTFTDAEIGTSYEYKYGYTVKNLDGTFTSYWEDTPNRLITVPAADSVLSMGYVNATAAPFEDATDSIDVFFRVNMSEQGDFNPEVHILSIAGSFQGWTPGASPLTQEGTSTYWNLHARFAAVGDTANIEMKYTWGAWDGTEEGNNRVYNGILADTTIQWIYYNDEAPIPYSSDATLTSFTLTTDVSNAVANNGFILGDTLIVKYGYGGTQTSVLIDTLSQVPFAYEYSWTGADLGVNLERGLYYQYYRIKNGIEYRETYFNFAYDGDDNALAERRFHDLTGAADGGTFTVTDNVNSNVDERRMPIFRNAEPLGEALTVTFTCDLRPAYYQVLSGSTLNDIQGDFDVTVADSVMAWGVWMNGPAAGGWTQWGGTLQGTTEQMMHDDGTNGDAVAGDSVYTVQFAYEATDPVGVEFKFGIHGGDNESGYGLNHIENVDVVSGLVEAYFGSINPTFYSSWDYDTNTPNMGIDPVSGNVPSVFSLSDNYPNPFNPTTNFEFSIPFASEVSVNIYNLLGENVATLHNNYAKPGTYSVTWDGLNNNGIAMPSGMYFYELKAGSSFHKVKKMTLLK